MTQVAILWEGDTPGDTRAITYNELYKQVNRLANVLKNSSVKKGGNSARQKKKKNNNLENNNLI